MMFLLLQEATQFLTSYPWTATKKTLEFAHGRLFCSNERRKNQEIQGHNAGDKSASVVHRLTRAHSGRVRELQRLHRRPSRMQTIVVHKRCFAGRSRLSE
jgi:hypothetical protein|eukprot:COSAG06_NODE_175_length_21137_cov_71.560790_2_plen_100_part_00